LQDGDDEKGDTALMKAAFKGNLPVFRVLLRERPSSEIEEMDLPGADPTVSSRDGSTALHYAVDQGFEDIVSF